MVAVSCSMPCRLGLGPDREYPGSFEPECLAWRVAGGRGGGSANRYRIALIVLMGVLVI